MPSLPQAPVEMQQATTVAEAPPAKLNPFVAVFVEALHRFNARKRKQRNLQQLIETRLETPVFFVVTATMVTRAAQLFSGGALVMSALLGKNYAAFEVATGLGLGMGSEMLMTIAGRSWRNWANEAAETQARGGMSKQAREAYVKRAKENSDHSRVVMLIGMGASLFAGLSYLFTNSGKPITGATFQDPQWWFNFVADLVAVTVVTTCVFYLGVLKENRGMSEAEEALSELDEGLNDAVKEAIKRFRDGKQTPVDEKLIAEHLSPSRKAKFLRAVAKINKGKVWTSRELRTRLGIGNDATAIRKLNKQINDLARDPDNALEKAPDGKTWLIPVRVVFETWGEDIAKHDAMLITASAVMKSA